MSTDHTPGKLTAATQSPSFDAIKYENGDAVFRYTIDDDGLHFKPEDARRLVACWNACIGLPTETLEQPDAFWKAKKDEKLHQKWKKSRQEMGNLQRAHIAKLKQRDDLLAALKLMLQQFTKTPSTLKDSQALANAHAVIARVEGGPTSLVEIAVPIAHDQVFHQQAVERMLEKNSEYRAELLAAGKCAMCQGTGEIFGFGFFSGNQVRTCNECNGTGKLAP